MEYEITRAPTLFKLTEDNAMEMRTRFTEEALKNIPNGSATIEGEEYFQVAMMFLVQLHLAIDRYLHGTTLQYAACSNIRSLKKNTSVWRYLHELNSGDETKKVHWIEVEIDWNSEEGALLHFYFHRKNMEGVLDSRLYFTISINKIQQIQVVEVIEPDPHASRPALLCD